MPATTSHKTNSNRRAIVLHVFACLCFIILPFLFFPRPQDILTPFNNPQTMRDVVGQCLLIGFFYLTYYFLIPKFYGRKRYLLFVIIVVICFATVTSLPSLLIHDNNNRSADQQPEHSYINGPDKRPPFFDDNRQKNRFPPDGEPLGLTPMNHRIGGSFSKEINHYIFLFLGVLFFAMTLRINNQWKQAQKEKTEAELSYLKAQINPHFLFNTLNSIYSLSVRQSDAAPEAIVKLAGMMRYVLQEADAARVPLEKEMAYLRDYVELQKLRFGNDVPVEFTISGDAGGKEIAPLILINFIENAFKHGVNAEEESHISIRIDIVDNSVLLIVRNNKVHVQNEEKSGTGLQNVKNRLSLLYPDKHQLSIEDTPDIYLVTLHIWLS